MSKHDDTVEQVRRLNPGLHWKKVEACLRHLGAEVFEGSGSTVTFVLDDRKLTVDRPHPRRECGIGLVKRVRSFLDQLGRL
jgi:predicted RNA binding protein YcfA (HicA-like mRNA interferase family)